MKMWHESSTTMTTGFTS